MPTFREILYRHDQTQGYTANLDYFLEADDEIGRKPPPNVRLMEHIAVDPTEDEYWNTSDPEDDEDQAARTAQRSAEANGGTTPSRRLVDYLSDEEADENADPEDQLQTSEGDAGIADLDSKSISVVTGPPERISEKRRREEDDEDELGKLMQSKRRNSSSGPAPEISTGMARRRKSFTAGSGNGTPKKIAISLSPTLKTGGGSRSDEDS